MIDRKELEKYSRQDLENIIINTCGVIEQFNIIADSFTGNFMFDMNEKTYEAKSLVNMWDMVDSKAACDVCDYKIRFKENAEQPSVRYGELGFIKVTEEVKKELIEQYNEAFDLINRMPLKGNEVLIGYAGGVMQTLGYLIDNIELTEPYKPQ